MNSPTATHISGIVVGLLLTDSADGFNATVDECVAGEHDHFAVFVQSSLNVSLNYASAVGRVNYKADE